MAYLTSRQCLHRALVCGLIASLMPADAAAFEAYSYGSISLTQVAQTPTASFSAASTSDNATIRDLSVVSDRRGAMPDIKVLLPWGLEATYRKFNQGAVHNVRGSATTTSCVRIAFKTFCAALQNSADGVITWKIEHQQIGLNKRVINSDDWNLRLGLGVDLMKAKANLVSTAYNESETGTAPLPYFLSKLSYKISKNYEAAASINYIDVTHRATAIQYLDAELALTRHLGSMFAISLGYQHQFLETTYSKVPNYTTLSSKLSSPFLRITLGY